MFTRKAFLNSAFILVGGLFCTEIIPMGGMPMPSPEELKLIESEIDNFVRSLPPEQQAQFYKDVEEMTHIMEQMSPDELNAFVEGVFTDAGLVPPADEASPASIEEPKEMPAPTPEVTEQKAEPVVTAPASETQKAVQMIESIIQLTQNFLMKADTIPELPGKIDKWVTQQKLKNLTESLEWNQVRNQIENFNTTLHTLLEKDPKTKEYRHIGSLIKQESLYNNLSQLQKNLTTNVPKVEVPPFGLDKVSKESRAAIREIMSAYLEAFYSMQIPGDLTKLISLYETRAQELTEEEKKLGEKAYTASSQPRQQDPMGRVGGQGRGYSDYYGSSYDTSSYDPYANYYGGGYSSSYPSSYSSDYYNTSPSSSRSTADTSEKDSIAGGGYAGSGARKSSASKGNDATATASKRSKTIAPDGITAEEDEKTPSAPSKTAKKDDAKDRKIMRIISDLETVTDAIKEYDAIKKFHDHMRDAKAFEASYIKTTLTDFVGTQMPTLERQLKKTTSDIKAFKRSLKSEEKDRYKTELESGLKDQVDFYKKLRKEIQDIELMWDKKYSSSMQLDRKYVYFGQGKENASAEVTAVLPEVPVTMFDLLKNINSFLDEATSTSKEK